MDLLKGAYDFDIDVVRRRIVECGVCPHSHQVFCPLPGYGQLHEPMLCVVGQYPGRGEDVLGQILTKEAGKFIRRLFYTRLGVSDNDVYWCNVVQCPLPVATEELGIAQMKNCAQHLDDLIDALNPKMIVGLGNNPRIRFFMFSDAKKKASSLLDARFRVWEYRGYPLVILMNPAVANRKKGFERELFEEGIERDFSFLRLELGNRGLIKTGCDSEREVGS